MNSAQLNNSLIDDEICFGKLSINEVKLHVLPVSKRRNTGPLHLQAESKDHDESVTLIRTTSEPNIITIDDMSFQYHDSVDDFSLHTSDQNEKFETSDESFLNMERIVSTLPATTQKNQSISNNECNSIYDIHLKDEIVNDEKIHSEMMQQEKKTYFAHILPKSDSKSLLVVNTDSKVANSFVTPRNQQGDRLKATESNLSTPFFTPIKFNNNQETAIKTLFKTPNVRQVKSAMKAISTKKTPMKSNLYNHIVSPVATYINNSPQVPLLKQVRPEKSLNGSSSIPIFVKTNANKENIKLPSIAYRSAKETKVIELTNTKLPQCNLAKKLASSLPRPMVIKHTLRENQVKSKSSDQDQSFANLSLHQADVSVLTQKKSQFSS